MSSPGHGILPDAAAQGGRRLLVPVARALGALGLSPNAVTVLGFLISVAGGFVLAAGGPGPGFVVLAAGAAADSLDGQLARLSGRVTVFGSFLDSTLDRVSDAAPLLAAAYVATRGGVDDVLLLVALWAIVASFLVPYARAKAESLGRTAAVGVAPREARTILLIGGVGLWWLTGARATFTVAIAITALLATITVVQRIAYFARQGERDI